MNDPMPRPAREAGYWSRISRVLGGQDGLSRRDIGYICLVLLVGVTVMFGPAIARLVDFPDPGPGWLEPEKLPQAKPVWTGEEQEMGGALIHGDVLLNFTMLSDGRSPDVYDLATGEQLMSGEDNQQSWVDGDNMVLFENYGARSATVHDIRTDEKTRTIKLDNLAHVTVASGTLVATEHNDGATSIRGIDVTTGKEKWARKLELSWADYGLGAPGPLMRDSFTNGVVDSYGFHPESDSPVVFLEERSDDEDTPEPIDAIDVATGKKKWSLPGDGGESDAPVAGNSQMTDSGDIYVYDEETGSYIVDADSGEVTEYPSPPQDESDEVGYGQSPLRGDQLLTADNERLAVVDVTTGKTGWRAKSGDDVTAFDGGLCFISVTYDPEDPSELEVNGTRVVDAATGKTLWTREDFAAMKTFVAGDAVISTGYKDFKDRWTPTRVFDRDTGKGLFQLKPANDRLLTYNEDYLVFATSDDDGGLGLAVYSLADATR